MITVLLFWYLILHQIGHAVYMTITLKDWKALGKLVWRTIDGTFATIGYLFYHIGYTQDLMWNIYGEAIEDVTTAKEDTLFGKKNVTVSTSIGKEEIDNKLVPSGKNISKVLNVAFNQKQHNYVKNILKNKINLFHHHRYLSLVYTFPLLVFPQMRTFLNRYPHNTFLKVYGFVV
jgi:hypothetical protein